MKEAFIRTKTMSESIEVLREIIPYVYNPSHLCREVQDTLEEVGDKSLTKTLFTKDEMAVFSEMTASMAFFVLKNGIKRPKKSAFDQVIMESEILLKKQKGKEDPGLLRSILIFTPYISGSELDLTVNYQGRVEKG